MLFPVSFLKECGSLAYRIMLKFSVGFLILGKLQTRDRLGRHVNTMPTIFPLCNSENESLSHLFVNYDLARQVWNYPAISNPLKINQTLNFIDWLNSVDSKNIDDLSDLNKVLLICW